MLSKFADEDSLLYMPGIAKVWTVEDEDFLLFDMYENWLLFP